MQVAGGELDDALALGVDGRASGQGTLKGRGIDAMHRRKERAELASDGGVAAVGGEGLSVEPGEAGKTEREGGAHRQRPERQRDRHRQQPREPAQRGDQRELAGTGALALRDADGDTARGSKHGGLYPSSTSARAPSGPVPGASSGGGERGGRDRRG